MVRFFSNTTSIQDKSRIAGLPRFARNDTTIWIGLFLLIAIVVFFFPDHALAAIDETKEFKDFVKAANNFLTFILKTMQAVFWPVLLMIGGLMDNELIFGGEMGEKLREIWVQIRNLVNVIFVLVLVVIAVYNVLGLGEQGPLQGLQLKQALPKFALALIVVNFSFLGAKVFLDFTNVLTTAVFSLPVNLEQEFPKFREEFQNTVCQPDQPLREGFCDKTGKPEFSAKGHAYFDNLERSNVVLVMAVSFGKLADQQIVKGGIESLGQLTFNIIFGVVIYVIYASAFIALLALLLARVVMLWVMVALSPLFALVIVLPQLATLGGEAGGNIGKKFMQHAIAPLVVGLFLSIGYIMIGALNRARGAHDAYFSQLRLEDIDPNTLITGMDDLHQMLASIAVAVLVWTGVFSAAKDTVASVVTEKIRSTVGGFGKFAATLPMYAPLIPVKEGAPKVSLAGLQTDLTSFQHKIETEGKERGIFKETGGYTSIKNTSNKEQIAQFVVANPGILNHQPELLVSELRRLGLGRVAQKLDDVKDKALPIKVQALYDNESEIKGLLPSNQGAFVERARIAPKPRTELRVREEYEPEAHAGKAYAAEQASLSETLKDAAKNLADFNNLLPKDKNVTEPQYKKLKEAFDGLGLSASAIQNFTFYQSGKEFDFNAVMDRFGAISQLKTLIAQPGGTLTPVQLAALEGLTPEFIQALPGMSGTRNKELLTTLQTNNLLPPTNPGEAS